MSDTVASSQRGASRFRWVVLAFIFVVYALAAADRANIGIALPHIQEEFGISNTEAGLIVSTFFLCYALGQIPAGMLISRTSVRWTTPAFMILTSLATGLIGTSGSALTVRIWRGVLGIAEAPLPLSILTTINRWFPPKEKGTATGVFLAAAKLGAVVAPPLGAVIIGLYGWRALFFAFAIPGFLLAVIWWLIIRDDPKDSAFTNEAEVDLINDVATEKALNARPRSNLGAFDRLLRMQSVPLLDSTKAVFRSKDIWACGIGYLLMTGVVNVLLAWLPKYLGDVKGLALLQIGFIASLPFVGGVLGNISGGWLSDKILDKRRKPTMIISAIATTLTMVALVYAPEGVIGVSLLLFLAGYLLNIGYSSFSVYSMSITTAETYPMAASVVNTAGQAGGALAPLAAGYILDTYDWNAVFLFLAVCSMAALFVIMVMREQKD
ncbi:MFS transporter [Agrobacterium rubi]|uniref:MFS transporter n=1 Tax=Agrobacterium rubi TaxID=28099 RepID=UPI001572F337|nr:MFS transporter [Agrobacterium rubi]NTF08914.1 MFS transporter [Agrobacterium rubi]NTF21185.1 MFS transporter [Agrobacterium rubi]NTF28042.1 MFS transporter [Agrobacterium rubi]